jgi:AcrR family transcriptional regulator
VASTTGLSARPVAPTLLAATAETLQRLGTRQFSLTAVAEVAGVSRGTVHNALGNRDRAIKLALDYLASLFIDAIAGAVKQEATLADQVAAAAELVCAHRRSSDLLAPRGVNESLLVLLLGHVGDDLIARSVDLWIPLVRAAAARGEVGRAVDPRQASEWILRVLLSFELLPPIGVDLDDPRAVRRFVADHVVAGLTNDVASTARRRTKPKGRP